MRDRARCRYQWPELGVDMLFDEPVMEDEPLIEFDDEPAGLIAPV
jgi:hypothetical protein